MLDEWPNPKDYKNFNLFNTAWHDYFKKVNPDWKNNDMYTNAQFDEIPFVEWEESGGTFLES